MKKMSVLLTLFVLSALILSACGGAGGNTANQTPGAGTTPQPGTTEGVFGEETPGGTGQETGAAPTEGFETAEAGGGGGAAGETPTASGAVDAVTPTVDEDLVQTPTGDAGAGGTGGATTSTPQAGAETTTTPQAGGQIPQTGAGQFVLLSDLMAQSVNGQTGDQVGMITGVVVERPDDATSGTGDTGGTGTQTTPAPGATDDQVGGGQTSTATPGVDTTPDADGAIGTGTPDAGDTGGATGGDMETLASGENAPRISYVLLNVTGQTGAGDTSGGTVGTDTTPEAGAGTGTPDAGGAGGGMTGTGTPEAGGGTGGTAGTAGQDQVLVPWEAFEVSGGMAGGTTGTGAQTTGTPAADETGTPEAGGMTGTGTPEVGANGVEMTTTPAAGGAGTGTAGQAGGDVTITLSIDSTALASAPRFDETTFTGQVSEDVSGFWASQGVGIPATGADTGAEGQAVLLRGTMTGFEVVDPQGQSFGQVSDFVVNAETGELAYALLSGTTGPEGNSFVVPTRILNWQVPAGGAATDAASMGQFQINVPADAFDGAPTIQSEDQLNLSDPTWNQQFEEFWAYPATEETQ